MLKSSTFSVGGQTIVLHIDDSVSEHFSCHAFAQTEWSIHQQILVQSVREEVNKQKKDYIVGVDENEYKSFLTERFALEPLELFTDAEEIIPRTEKQGYLDDFGRTGYREVYTFLVAYPFRGSARLFEVKPSMWTMWTFPIRINDQTVSFEFTLATKDANEFKRKRNEAFRDAFVNLENINRDVNDWNQRLPQLVNEVFDARKKHFLAENQFFAAINIAPDPATKAIFTVPTIKRRIVPRPEIRKGQQVPQHPTMSDEMYEDVLQVLYQAGQAMERKPSLYRGKDEEGLRDQFLLFLETRYAATTGTSETFNKAGKTDILLKYEDGTNLFVAECKWWKGEAEFHGAIKQLFDRYLTWRDSKAALLLFVPNKDFSAVVEKVRAEAKQSPYFVRSSADRDETSLAFDFHLSNDEKRIVRFAVLLLTFP
jgi:hypothetical protein